MATYYFIFEAQYRPIFPIDPNLFWFILEELKLSQVYPTLFKNCLDNLTFSLQNKRLWRLKIVASVL